MSLESKFLDSLVTSGQYIAVLTSSAGRRLINEFGRSLEHGADSITASAGTSDADRLAVGLAAFNAFLQAVVTGPVLEDVALVEQVFEDAAKALSTTLRGYRKLCFTALESDGVSPYTYIPNIELFCLARYALITIPDAALHLRLSVAASARGSDPCLPDVRWLRMRVHVWHYKLLTQPSLGPGSVLSKSSQWNDVPSLEERIEQELAFASQHVLGSTTGNWTRTEKVLFLIEKASVYIMLGQDSRARQALKQAAEENKFAFKLSGALGKRTRFQQHNTSQLVVLAQSSHIDDSVKSMAQQAVPTLLPLNDDTLLEQLEFAKGTQPASASTEEDALDKLSPDAQQQLSAPDEMILLTEATIIDAFSPADSLTAEEVLPFAVRVLSDRSTNWQVYTQALLVRSRIEVHRSRTVERGVLQMQALVDQVIVETTATGQREEVLTIAISAPGSDDDQPTLPSPLRKNKPISFFPAAKPAEMASAPTRLEYVHVLASPPRWHLESELAHMWASVGSLASALAIFRRLHLWAEVALCLAGTGEHGQEQARAVLRWRLFQHEDATANSSNNDDDEVDLSELRATEYASTERIPLPPDAPRLLCILGDMEDDDSMAEAHYERAWAVSGKRFARAQQSLGERRIRRGDWAGARDAFQSATAANRVSEQLWGRLGDSCLRLGQFEDAAEAYGRAVALAGDSAEGGGDVARTWSNLGSALYSLYAERMAEKEPNAEKDVSGNAEDDGDTDTKRSPATLLSQALAAYKRGASIAGDNWRIWDNVLTLAARMRPPVVADMVAAQRAMLRLRATEHAVDAKVLRALLRATVLSQPQPKQGEEPERGSAARSVCELIEDAVAPLITGRSELWALVALERGWRRDDAGAVDAAERGWRAAIAGGGADEQWLEDKQAWRVVVERTDELVTALEKYGPHIPSLGARWQAKARNAVRSVMGKAREAWEGSEEWERLATVLDGLRTSAL